VTGRTFKKILTQVRQVNKTWIKTAINAWLK